MDARKIKCSFHNIEKCSIYHIEVQQGVRSQRKYCMLKMTTIKVKIYINIVI